MLPGTTYIRLDGGNLIFSGNIRAWRNGKKKKERHMFGNLESQKHVPGYTLGMEWKITPHWIWSAWYYHKRIGAAATHPPKKEERKTKRKNTRKEKRGLEPTHLESYCCCKQCITQAPINPLGHPKKERKKKEWSIFPKAVLSCAMCVFCVCWLFLAMIRTYLVVMYVACGWITLLRECMRSSVFFLLLLQKRTWYVKN